jgi:hypothetical protein
LAWNKPNSGPNLEKPNFEPFRTQVCLSKLNYEPTRTLQKSWTLNPQTGFNPTLLVNMPKNGTTAWYFHRKFMYYVQELNSPR